MTDQALIPIKDIEAMALAVANSKLFGCKTKDEAMALMLLSQAEGVHPMVAVQEFHIIQGKPARKAESILARFQRAGGTVKWETYSDTKVTGTFTHPQGGSVTVSWDMAKASAAGLAARDNWKKFPAPMLRSRVITEGVRTVYPAAFGGAIAVEEVDDIVNMGPAEVVERKPVSMPQPLKTYEQPVEGVSVPKMETEPLEIDEPPLPELPISEAMAASPVAAPEGEPIVAGAIRIVTMKLAAAGKSDKDLLERFGVDKVEKLRQSQVNGVLSWLK